MSKIKLVDYLNTVEANRQSIINKVKSFNNDIVTDASLTQAVNALNNIIIAERQNPTLYPVSNLLKHEVRFFDADGTLLKTEYVEDGGTATPPDDPNFDSARLSFVCWGCALGDNTFSPIISDMDYMAVYTPIDGKTYLFIHIDDVTGYTITPNIRQYWYGTLSVASPALTIDWGDGTTDKITTSSYSSLFKPTHTYITAGDYEIVISANYTNACKDSPNAGEAVWGVQSPFITTATGRNWQNIFSCLKRVYCEVCYKGGNDSALVQKAPCLVDIFIVSKAILNPGVNLGGTTGALICAKYCILPHYIYDIYNTYSYISAVNRKILILRPLTQVDLKTPLVNKREPYGVYNSCYGEFDKLIIPESYGISTIDYKNISPLPSIDFYGDTISLNKIINFSSNQITQRNAPGNFTADSHDILHLCGIEYHSDIIASSHTYNLNTLYISKYPSRILYSTTFDATKSYLISLLNMYNSDTVPLRIHDTPNLSDAPFVNLLGSNYASSARVVSNLELPENYTQAISLSTFIKLTDNSFISIFNSLKDLTETTAKTFSINTLQFRNLQNLFVMIDEYGLATLSTKTTENAISLISALTNKNWTVSVVFIPY